MDRLPVAFAKMGNAEHCNAQFSRQHRQWIEHGPHVAILVGIGLVPDVVCDGVKDDQLAIRNLQVGGANDLNVVGQVETSDDGSVAISFLQTFDQCDFRQVCTMSD